MDCSHFRRQHLAYLDDTLPGDQMTAAQRHLLLCDACAAHDTRVRRALLLARNLPPVTPRADFRARLDARLAECRTARVPDPGAVRSSLRLVEWSEPARSIAPGRGVAVRPLAAMAASAVLGALAWQLFRSARPPELAMQPVLAVRSPVQAMPPHPLPPLPAAFTASPSAPMASPFLDPGFVPVGATHAAY